MGEYLAHFTRIVSLVWVFPNSQQSIYLEHTGSFTGVPHKSAAVQGRKRQIISILATKLSPAASELWPRVSSLPKVLFHAGSLQQRLAPTLHRILASALLLALKPCIPMLLQSLSFLPIPGLLY